jgi:hypothetical protein
MNTNQFIEMLRALESKALRRLDEYQRDRVTHGEQFYQGYLTAILHMRGQLQHEKKDNKEVPTMRYDQRPRC